MIWTLLLIIATVLGLVLAARCHGSLREAFAEISARLFPRRPVPARVLPRRLLECANRTATIGVSGRTMLPGRIELRIHPEDLAPFRGALGWLQADIRSGVEQRAGAERWDTPAGVMVDIVSDATRPVGRPVGKGVFTFRERARTGGHIPLATVPPTTVPNTREALTEEPVTTALGPCVEVRVDDRPPVVVPVGAGGFVIGRGRHATIRVADRAASRAHCRIHRGIGGLAVTDLSSTNGTTLDGTLVGASSRLPVAGTIAVGRSRIGFRVLNDNEVSCDREA